MPFLTEEVVDKRVKEKQVKVLRDLVTVSREHRIMHMSKRHGSHWFLETGKVI